MKALRKSFVALSILISGCSSEPSDTLRADGNEAPDPRLDGSVIAEIPGNEGHNMLARETALGRAMALANVVKTLENKQYCSPEKTFFRGTGKGMSFWALQCHDGQAFQVLVKRDGSGGTIDCAITDRLEGEGDCWKPLKAK
jgi:hypothetical protein